MNPPLTLPDLVHSRSGGDDQAPALVAPGRQALCFAALRQQTAATVSALRRAGVGRRDTVAVVLPNGPELAAVSIAIASGARCAPLNPAFRADEFRFYLGDLEPAALLLPAADRADLRAIAASLHLRCLDVQWTNDAPAGTHTLDGGGAHEPQDVPGSDDIALLLHTSGTTSRPKLVPLTHRNLATSAINVVRALELSPRDRSLNVMPLFHIHGFVASLLASLASGGSVACCAGFRDGEFLPWLAALQPSWYTATPAIPTVAGRLAAKLVHPDRPVIAICGDFAFGVSAMELETAVRHHVPIVVVVANNDGNSGALRQRAYMGAGDEPVMRFEAGVRYERIMEMFGGHAQHVDRAEDIRPAIERALASTRPACINVAVDPDAPFPSD